MNTDPEALAQRVLHLERQIESYARLHAQELDEMRKTLQELKDALLLRFIERNNDEHSLPRKTT